MIAQFNRGFVATYVAFTSARSTLIAQLLIVILLGVVTIAGMTYVAKQENESTISDLMR